MSKTNANILVIDDDEDILQSMRLFLALHFDRITVDKNPGMIPNLIQRTNYDVVILDMNFTAGISSGNEGIYWMNKILEHDPAAIVILMTAYGDIDLAVRAIREGATDFIQKPWNEEKLLATVHTAVKLRRSKVEILNLRNKQKHLSENIDREFRLITGSSPAMKHVMDTINKVATTDANVLLLGENGTGKEIMAREIHKRSLRADEVFISVDMGALPETLFESEMFGYIKGAFTDAHQDRPGRFEIASGGTLFLDEIANLSLTLQSKLLSVLQNRTISRIGSTQYIPIDIRLISATNKNLDRLIRTDEFREDLLYRINTIQIEIPPLRDRKEDIPALANHFLDLYSRKYGKKDLLFTPSVMKEMENYSWPGNIRELRHNIEKAVILTESKSIKPEVIFKKYSDEKTFNSASFNLEENERRLIINALALNKGNMARTARKLGVSRKTLYNKMKKFNL
ncbi:MAG: AAA family ATPase [Bacteroides sp. SM23_62_1]|nr:MAG: AAA family ATPase [Bacteroides sp. SM23_62_1]